MSERTAAECFPVSHYIREEMEARGWDVAALAREMTRHQLTINTLAIEMQLELDGDPAIIVTEDWAVDLGRAFGIDPEFFLNLDRQYHEWLKVRGDDDQA